MKKTALLQKLRKMKTYKFWYVFNKRQKIPYLPKLKHIIAHKGMWLVKVDLFSFSYRKRVGEFVFTRKPFKRPNKLKKRECYINTFIENIFFGNILRYIQNIFCDIIIVSNKLTLCGFPKHLC